MKILVCMIYSFLVLSFSQSNAAEIGKRPSKKNTPSRSIFTVKDADQLKVYLPGMGTETYSFVTIRSTIGSDWGREQIVQAYPGDQMEVLAPAKRSQGINVIKVRHLKSDFEGYVFWAEFIGTMKSDVLRKPEPTLKRRNLLTDGTGIQASGRKIKVAFFDADGTLRITKSGTVAPNKSDDVFILPGVKKKLKELKDQGYFIAIVSNQGGVSQGYLSLETADQALFHTIQLIDPEGKVIDYFDFAEEYKTSNNPKPGVGMGERLQTVLQSYILSLDKESSFMVGDAGSRENDFSDSDRKFAENFGVPFHHARDFFSWSPDVEARIKDYSITKEILCREVL